MIAELLKQLHSLATAVRRNEAVNVNNKTIKAAAIAAGSFYFKECRGDALKVLVDEKALAELDHDWQQLIRLAHGNNARNSYLSLLRRLVKKTTSLTVASHVASDRAVTNAMSPIGHSEAENILLVTLEQLVPSASASYRQGLNDLTSDTPRFSYRGVASEFREALREALDILAPDQDVIKQSWYKPEPNTNGPTMKQKVRHILASRGKSRTQQGVAEKSIDLIEGLCGDLARAVYNRASLSTHVKTTREEVRRMKRYLDAVLFDILEIGQTA